MINEELLVEYGAKLEHLEKGEYLFHENDRANNYFQLKTGKILMMNVSSDGKIVAQGHFNPGQSFGEPPLFDDSTYPACALAEEDSTLFKLRKTRFFKLLKKNPDIHFQFTKILAIRLQFKSMLLKEISGFKPEHRILTLLDYTKTTAQIPLTEKQEVKLTRQQIADLTGLRVETVIRAVKELEKLGEVALINHKIFR
ncbi:MAG: Crp/Fnr family transcriptional regulator [Salinivirgaceae bacterium]